MSNQRHSSPNGQPNRSQTPNARTQSMHEWSISSLLRLPGRRSVESMVLLIIVAILVVFGLTMVLSASHANGLTNKDLALSKTKNQAMWIGLGLVPMFFVMRINYRVIPRFGGATLIGTVVLLLLVRFTALGHSVNGSQRWLKIGESTIQPAEFAKIAVCIFATWILITRRDQVHDNTKVFYVIMAATAVPVILVLLQPAMGTAVMIMGAAMITMFVGGVSLWTFSTTALLGVFGALFLALGSEYRRERIQTWLDPFSDQSDKSYQVINSMQAISRGRGFGVGLGESGAKWGIVPEAHTDFIFTVVAEETGFVGSLSLIVLYLALSFIGFRIAYKAPDRAGMLLAAGLSTTITMQALYNIGTTMSLTPLSGLPLPFVSVGGSSVMMNLIAVGVIANIARQIDPAEKVNPNRRPNQAAALKARQNQAQLLKR